MPIGIACIDRLKQSKQWGTFSVDSGYATAKIVLPVAMTAFFSAWINCIAEQQMAIIGFTQSTITIGKGNHDTSQRNGTWGIIGKV